MYWAEEPREAAGAGLPGDQREGVGGPRLPGVPAKRCRGAGRGLQAAAMKSGLAGSWLRAVALDGDAPRWQLSEHVEMCLDDLMVQGLDKCNEAAAVFYRGIGSNWINYQSLRRLNNSKSINSASAVRNLASTKIHEARGGRPIFGPQTT